jgi:hypothetical protein
MKKVIAPTDRPSRLTPTVGAELTHDPPQTAAIRHAAPSDRIVRIAARLPAPSNIRLDRIRMLLNASADGA